MYPSNFIQFMPLYSNKNMECFSSFSYRYQERIKLRERTPHIGPILIVISLKIFLDLLLDPLFPRELSQSHVLNFTKVDSWAKSHAMLREVRESNCKRYCSRIRFVDECDFKEVSVMSALKRRSTVA